MRKLVELLVPAGFFVPFGVAFFGQRWGYSLAEMGACFLPMLGLTAKESWFGKRLQPQMVFAGLTVIAWGLVGANGFDPWLTAYLTLMTAGPIYLERERMRTAAP